MIEYLILHELIIVELCRFHSFGGRSKVSDLQRHRKSGSNTSLPEMYNNNGRQYDSSSAVSKALDKLTFRVIQV